MTNEMSVAEFYSLTTASFCAPIASMLALHPHLPTWVNTLIWTVTPSKGAYAIADGTLKTVHNELDDSDDEEMKELQSLVDNSPMGRLLELIRSKITDLGVWEIKSLSVGDEPTMQGIRREANTGIQFRWERFGHNERGMPRRRFDPPPIGPDAKKTPWTLSTSDSNDNSGSSAGPDPASNEPSELPSSNADDNPGPSAKPDPATPFGSPLTALPSSDADEQEAPTASKRARGRGRATKRRRLDDNDENYKTTNELTAESFIQQVRSSLSHLTVFIISSFQGMGRRGTA
jgi:hypothetical protein